MDEKIKSKKIEKVEKKKCGRKKKLPEDAEERKQYKKEHYYHNTLKYQAKKRIEDKIEQLKKMYELVKNSDSFEDIKDELLEKVKVKNF